MIPPDWMNELADRLSQRRVEPPSTELGERVRGSVAAELRRARSSSAGTSWLVFAAGLAAAFLIAASLSLIAASDMRAAPPQANSTHIAATARAIRRLAPELSETDALRISVIDDARAGFVCIPQPQVSDARSAQLLSFANGETP